jgi:hypothetical protein
MIVFWRMSNYRKELSVSKGSIAYVAYTQQGSDYTKGLQTTARGTYPGRDVILSGPRKNCADMRQLN